MNFRTLLPMPAWPLWCLAQVWGPHEGEDPRTPQDSQGIKEASVLSQGRAGFRLLQGAPVLPACASAMCLTQSLRLITILNGRHSAKAFMVSLGSTTKNC